MTSSGPQSMIAAIITVVVIAIMSIWGIVDAVSAAFDQIDRQPVVGGPQSQPATGEEPR